MNATLLVGLPAAPGIAVGRAVLLSPPAAPVPRYTLTPQAVPAELARLAAARAHAMDELQHLARELDDGVASGESELAALLEVHLLMLQDDIAYEAVHAQIREQHHNAEWAVWTQAQAVMHPLLSADDDYLRARRDDIMQVRDLVLRALQATALVPSDAAAPEPTRAAPPVATDADAGPRIAVAHDLSPADLLQLKRSGYSGFVTDVGGATGHAAIIARSMGIPAIVGAASASTQVRANDELLLDGGLGQLWINPTPAQRDAYRAKRRARQQRRCRLSPLRNQPAQTQDGHAIELLANIEHPLDCAAVQDVGAHGVGLFRTEFLFMRGPGQLPDEDAQFALYRDVVQAMGGAPVTIRSADIGADKLLPDMADTSTNPALGLRGIRWGLARPQVLLTQLRAILRAAAHGPVQLLIPMLTHVPQMDTVFDLLAQARAQLAARGMQAPVVPVGAMIEVPAAALIAPVFLRRFDFLSIGTNDLVQYTLAVDRADATLAPLFDPLHPAVLRLIAEVIQAADAAGKRVTLCGEMAGDPRYVPLLIGLGLRSFSMHAGRLLTIKDAVLQTDASQWHNKAQAVLHSDDPSALLREMMPLAGASA